jgi:hypothetical protein
MEQKETMIQAAVRSGLNHREYLSPKVRNIRLSMENVICASPVPGGNEDIGYDEW